jgi:hypothetical protein
VAVACSHGARYRAEMSDQGVAGEREWPTHCPLCGAELKSAVIDFDPNNENRVEFQAGEMAAVDYCPNPTCPGKDSDSKFAGTPEAGTPE